MGTQNGFTGKWDLDAIKAGAHGVYPQCPKNTMSIPSGSTELHKVFEEYAVDQAKWVDDFIKTYEKMLENGYQSGELVDGPDVNANAGVKCSHRTVVPEIAKERNEPYRVYWYNCWVDDYPQDLSSLPQFKLVNMFQKDSPDHPDRVLESEAVSGHAKLMDPDPNNPNPLWVQFDAGEGTDAVVILNVGTRMPLGSNGGRTWRIGETGFIETSILPSGQGSIYCHRQIKEGERCRVTPKAWEDPAHRFYVEYQGDVRPTTQATTPTEPPTFSDEDCRDTRAKGWCNWRNQRRCTNEWWFPKVQCLASCGYCEEGGKLLCMDYDKTADCAAVKNEGQCDRTDKMGRVWRFRCFKTCGCKL